MRTKLVNVYTYSELSEKAKEAAKEYLNSDDGSLIESMNYHLGETEFVNAEVSFSLGYSQGDGVSFVGSWENNELLAILNKSYEIAGMPLPTSITAALPYLTLNITRNNHRYVHEKSVTLSIEANNYENYWYSAHNANKILTSMEKIIDSYRISICKTLEKQGYAEIEYSYSDEAMIELCDSNDYEFYANGELA